MNINKDTLLDMIIGILLLPFYIIVKVTTFVIIMILTIISLVITLLRKE